MRIIQVIDELRVGGAEKMFVLISNIIEVDNCILLKKSELDRYLPKNSLIFYINRKFKYSIYSIFKTYKIIKNYDIIHVHSRHNFKYITLVQKLFLMRTPVVLHDHFAVQINSSIPFGFSFFFKPKYYIGVSEYNVNWYQLNLNNNKNDFILLRNTINFSDHIETKYSFLNNKIISIGNLRDGKNHLLQLRIIKLLTTYQLHIVGKIQDENYYINLKKEIDKLELADRVFFHFDFNDGIDAIMDIKPKFAVHTSEFESGPLVLLEYAALGIPFLSNLTGDISIQFSKLYPELFIEINNDVFCWVENFAIIEKDYVTYSNGLVDYFAMNFSKENYKQKLLKFYQCLEENY
jgi:glycosyltransferase involved in cell wall biosynthesis